jgi:hypothetical protein
MRHAPSVFMLKTARKMPLAFDNPAGGGRPRWPRIAADQEVADYWLSAVTYAPHTSACATKGCANPQCQAFRVSSWLDIGEQCRRSQLSSRTHAR